MPAAGDAVMPGQLDEYRLIKLLGQGAMGRVYVAYDTSLERHVAIKLIHQPDARRRQRLILEARASARLQHPNIVAIHRIGRWRAGRSQAAGDRGDHESAQPYIVEEYIHGPCLGAMPRPMPWRQVYTLARGIARGLAAAHRAGVLHRDIKAANVMLSEHGEPKLVDFGLAKLVLLPAGAGVESAPSPASDEPGDRSVGNAIAADPAAGAGTDRSLPANPSDDHAVLGTPYYIAPELWRGEAATPRSDVYALGVLMFELCCGRVPYGDTPMSALAYQVNERDAPSLAGLVGDMDSRFAALIARCLARAPELRFGSGEEVRDALEELDWASRKPGVPGGNPYRGLLHFEAEHAGLFFGRNAHIRDVVERLRVQPVVLIGGESGTGKSSLMRAGVVPYIVEHGLGDRRRWDAITLVPGRRPFSLLVSELGERFGIDEAILASELKCDIAAALARIRRAQTADIVRGTQAPGTGLVICVDQLEELVTAADAGEAILASSVLANLAERNPAVRVLATVRGDRITALMRFPGLAGLLERALYLVRPLGTNELREAIVGPARASGACFESTAMVDALVATMDHERGTLPLLQFALSQLWEARDHERGVIPERALEEIGGVEGALSRHADRVLGTLLPENRELAKRLLIRLVTADGSRARRSEAELAAPDGSHRAILDALVAARLLVVGESGGEPFCEIAHEALVTGWTTFRMWLDEEGEKRVFAERLGVAAAQWRRAGEGREALWRGRWLRDGLALPREELSDLERAFIDASSRAAVRARVLASMVVALPVVAVAILYGLIRYQEHRQRDADVNRLVRRSEGYLAQLRPLDLDYQEAREAAFVRFRAGDMAGGEELWSRALEQIDALQAGYAQAATPLELALMRAPERRDVRGRMAEVLHAQVLIADATGDEEERDSLLQRLSVYDASGAFAAPWTAPVPLRVTTRPQGLPVRLYRVLPAAGEPTGEGGAWNEVEQGNVQRTPARWELPPGSYVVVIPAGKDTIEVRYPVLLRGAAGPLLAARRRRSRDVDVAVDIDVANGNDIDINVPALGDMPDDYLFISEGRFLFGYGADRDIEPVRHWFKTLPAHERRTGGYWIARHETTYEQWIDYMRSLQPGDRARRLPRSRDPSSSAYVELRAKDDEYELHWHTSIHEYKVTEDEMIEYRDRDRRRLQRWQRFPVSGISGEDALAYVAWLDETGRVAGARLCREDEWERAARGADSRLYSHGNRLHPDDANFDKTYPGGGFGFDEVGSHPRSTSPFGAADMIGNVRELATSIFEQGGLVLRSGAYFYSERTSAAVNREVVLWTQRLPYVGFRVCADEARRQQ